MSAEDDTFDIDIYGDEGQEDLLVDDDLGPLEDEEVKQQTEVTRPEEVEKGPSQTSLAPAEPSAAAAAASQTSLKRKAPDDETPEVSHHQAQRVAGHEYHSDDRPVDPGATPALRLGELFWWTNEEDLRAYAVRAGVEEELQDVAFGEHKINGKSRGEAYLEFASPQAATATKREIDKVVNAEVGSKNKVPFTIYYEAVGNPFKAFQKEGGGNGAVGGKKEFNKYNSQSSGGAYNQSFAGNRGGRGGFVNRGGGFGGGRGGYNNNNNSNNNNANGMMQNGVGGWGMQGNFGSNPMMAGFNNNMGGGFGMGRGGGNMMGGMMGRGGYGGMGGMNGMGMNMNMMGNMMGMNGGRGGMMGGRGGWNGGYNQGGGMQQGGYGGGGYVDGNKRMRTD